MNSNASSTTDPLLADWTQGGECLVFQQCGACAHTWYFHREFCPVCGNNAPVSAASNGRGTVQAGTLVLRAPTDEFRAVAPYRIVLVDIDEGFRVMGHGALPVVIGDRVQCQMRLIAGRLLPFFDKESHES